MVSLYITAIAKLIQRAATAEEVYARLRSRWYLSLRALSHPEDVMALIRDAQMSNPKDPPPGQELSRDIVDALSEAGFLSVLGRTWGMRFRSRR